MGLYGSHRSKHTEEFPLGTNLPEPTTLIVCMSSQHRKEVTLAFNIPAMYVLPGAQLEGRSFDKIIIFTPTFDSGSDMIRFKQYIEQGVLHRRKINGKVYYV